VLAGMLFGIFAAWIGLQAYPALFHWLFELLGFSLW
jgi:hypothetical protein